MPSATPAHLNDEDFINKSLLASLDAQADAEPVPTDDDIHDDDPNITRYALSRHPAPDDQQDQYAAFHHLHGAEGLYSVHQGLYSSQAQHMHQEYSAEYMHHPHHPPGAQQTHAQAAKLNGFAGAPNYRNSFTSYPNTTRTRHQVNQSVLAASSSYREQGATFYPSQDTFPGQITSPVMQQYGSYDYQQQSHQQQLHPHQQQPHQQQQSQPVANGLHKSPYLIDPYAASSKSSAQQQQQQQPAPGQGQSYAFSSGIGVQLSSQTPYGPHVPAGVAIGVPPSSNANNVNSNAGIPPGLSTSVSIGMANGNGPTTTANGEEISTIFVVGFPEDMQEREFQNMFTFSPGFEAATLKIPHKEYNAYNPLLSGSGAANGIGGAAGAQGVARGYGVANDPYNLVQVNQGGVVDAGRDGWPAQPQGEDLVSHYAMGGMGINPLNTLNPLSSLASLNSLNPLSAQAQAQTANTLSLALPPRKQIIGFAKFRSREEALVARDVLQGRRVDIEKGAVLKAEMAKKNLHTKRGVGLVGGVGQVGTVGQQVAGPHSNGGAIDNLAFGVPEPGLARIGHWQRENGPSMSAGQPGAAATSLSNSQSIDGLTVDGLNGKDSNGNASSGVPTDDEGRKRDSVGLVGAMGLSSLGSLSIGGGIRGAREREEEERERERRRRGEREMNLMRLRASNSAAFDAFHGVSTTSTVNGAPTNGASVTSHVAVGGNASASATVMSRQSSGTSSSSLWGSPAITAAAVAATTIDSPSQLGQGQENTALAPTEQQLDLLESSHDHEDDYEDHLEQMHQQLDEEEEELERQQMEQERKEEEELMHREYHEQLQQQEHAQAQAQQGPDDVAAGPWDRIHGVVSYAAVARPSYLGGGGNAGSTMGANANAQAHPSSSSERSTSPGSFLDAHHGPGQAQPQGGYIPQFQHLQYHHDQQKQLQLQRQSQQFGQQPTLHNAHHGQHNQGYRTQSESSETSAIDVAASNPAGYVGAAPMRPLGVHTNGILERLQQHASSSSSSTSASVSTSTSASTSALASGSTSAFASSVSSSTSTSAGNTGGSANGNGGGVSPLPAGSSTGSGSANTSAPGSAGNTSPQLPSPAGSGGSASTTSLRGTVDQNPPINTLYVGNLPTSPPPLGYPNDYLEETLREVFSARPGYRKLCFRHKANGPMCFVEFEDVQFATKALAEMSGNTLRGAVKNGIRLSYSKNPLGVRTSNNSGGQTTSGSSTPSQAQQFAQVPNNAGQYQQGPQSAGSESFLSRSADDFSGHQQQQQQHRLPTSILRRDSTLSPTSPTYSSGNANSYFASPPPRFYSAGSPTGTTQLTGASTAFVPRASAAAAAAANGFGGYGASAGGGFSPFGMPFGSGEQLGSFGQPMLHQHQSYNQHSIPEGQFPQQQQQQQQQPDE